jgi:hypothetical protein
MSRWGKAVPSGSEGRGQRHRAAHTGECDHEHRLPRRVVVGIVAADQPRHVRAGKHPGEAGDHHHDGHERNREQNLVERKRLRLLDQEAHLKTGEQEQRALDEVDDEVPEEDALQPCRR